LVQLCIRVEEQIKRKSSSRKYYLSSYYSKRDPKREGHSSKSKEERSREKERDKDHNKEKEKYNYKDSLLRRLGLRMSSILSVLRKDITLLNVLKREILFQNNRTLEAWITQLLHPVKKNL